MRPQVFYHKDKHPSSLEIIRTKYVGSLDVWTALLGLYFLFHILCKVHLSQDEEILEDNFFQFMHAYQRH